MRGPLLTSRSLRNSRGRVCDSAYHNIHRQSAFVALRRQLRIGRGKYRLAFQQSAWVKRIQASRLPRGTNAFPEPSGIKACARALKQHRALFTGGKRRVGLLRARRELGRLEISLDPLRRGKISTIEWLGEVRGMGGEDKDVDALVGKQLQNSLPRVGGMAVHEQNCSRRYSCGECLAARLDSGQKSPNRPIQECNLDQQQRQWLQQQRYGKWLRQQQRQWLRQQQARPIARTWSCQPFADNWCRYV